MHGDDFLSTATPENLKWLENALAKELDFKTQILGPPTCPKARSQIIFLGRVVSWEQHGLRYEADPTHAELIISQLELRDAKPVTTPGVTATHPRNENDDENPPLGAAEASQFRGVAARTNFLSQDRVDIQYASKEASRWMSRPRKGDWEVLNRIGRYLLSHPRMTLVYGWRNLPTEITTYSDTDWAGCKDTRRSTSGGVVMHGKHRLRSWSRMQTLVALSSAEAELYGTVRASCEALGCKSMIKDYGRIVGCRLYADASAALGIIQRIGLGKVRHLETNSLWIQQACRTKIIQYLKVPGEHNPADVLTKHLAEDPRKKHISFIGLQLLAGRPAAAPKVTT